MPVILILTHISNDIGVSRAATTQLGEGHFNYSTIWYCYSDRYADYELSWVINNGGDVLLQFWDQHGFPTKTVENCCNPVLAASIWSWVSWSYRVTQWDHFVYCWWGVVLPCLFLATISRSNKIDNSISIEFLNLRRTYNSHDTQTALWRRVCVFALSVAQRTLGRLIGKPRKQLHRLNKSAVDQASANQNFEKLVRGKQERLKANNARRMLH